MIEEKFRHLAAAPSDIREHFPVLREYSAKCESVVELGVREIVSTWALLAGHPQAMASVDVRRPSKIGEVYAACLEAGISFEFVQGDTLQIEPIPCDLLFIDTWHTYQQCLSELRRHGPHAKRFILLHDTTLYATRDE